ncbi:S9 family peptidase [candidate division WOR-3 bacterium]|nr:S9 family peptidase [candidate division WOR-3 bacterium]
MCVAASQQGDDPVRPPIAPVIPRLDTVHNEVRVDDYYWLRDRDNPEVIAYLEAENDYAAAMMERTGPLQNRLYEEMLARIKETDLSVPVKLDEYYYYSRTEQGKQYSIYCRARDEHGREEEVLLDLNALAGGHSYLELGAHEVSPDHRMLVYSIDTAGSERYTLYIKDLGPDTLYEERIGNVGYEVAWANDNQTFFYTVLDEAKRPHEVYRHILGTPAHQDQIIYHERDEAFWVGISKTRSEQYLLITAGSHTTSEVYYCDADAVDSGFALFRRREPDVEYYIDHRGASFYVLTNNEALNFRLLEVPVHNHKVAEPREIIAHRDSVMLAGFDVFEKYLVVYEREDGLKQIRVIDFDAKTDHRIDLSEPTYAFWPVDNPEFRTDGLRFVYSSLVTPRTVFDYDMRTRERELKKQFEVLGGYDPAQYRSERIYAPANDGTRIPISLVYRKDIEQNGKNPLLLEAYGAYGSSAEPYFSANRLNLLDRGFVYAIAHVRGGGEMGKAWHEQAQFLQKMNTFTDFIACSQYLIEEKYTSNDRLVISGGSAGGLLIGAVVNMEPGLFKAAVADVPFVDVINTLLDPSIPLTVVEYTELGDPADEEVYQYMKRYSPYDNIQPRAYPHMLITAGFNDTRVGYWEPAKCTAKLRALKTDDNLLLLKTNMAAGHGGASGRYDYLRDVAFEYAFMLKALGIAE